MGSECWTRFSSQSWLRRREGGGGQAQSNLDLLSLAICSMTIQLCPPKLDPAPIFETFRGNYAMELLTAAVAHFGVFERLASEPLSAADLQQATGLGERQFIVLTTGLKALGLLEEKSGRLQPTAIAREH